MAEYHPQLRHGHWQRRQQCRWQLWALAAAVTSAAASTAAAYAAAFAEAFAAASAACAAVAAAFAEAFAAASAACAAVAAAFAEAFAAASAACAAVAAAIAEAFAAACAACAAVAAGKPVPTVGGGQGDLQPQRASTPVDRTERGMGEGSSSCTPSGRGRHGLFLERGGELISFRSRKRV